MPFQNKRVIISATPVFSLQLTQQPGNMSPNLQRIEGYYQGAVQAWLQFFDSLGAPNDGTVPIYEEYLGAVTPNGYTWDYGSGVIQRLNSALASKPLVNGLIVCVSTTQGALTIATGSNKSSFYVSLEEWETLPQGSVTQSGDTTTLVNCINPWADGVFHTLDKIIVSNTTNVPRYFKLFTVSPTVGMLPLAQWTFVPNQPLTELNFRGVGFVPQTLDTTTSPPTIHSGCFLYDDGVPGAFADLSFAVLTIQANYI